MTRRHGLFGGVAVLALLIGSRADAQTEVRQFKIFVDGKRAGQYTMNIERRKDGTVSMTGNASVQLKIFLRQYIYSFQGQELWSKSGRLMELSSTSNDDGKSFDVHAKADDKGINVTVNGSTRPVRWDVWTTSYWKAPDKSVVNKTVALLDADNGKTYSGTVQKIGSARVTMGGKALDCEHYRVEGGPNPIDLWFDKDNRLVRQDFVEQGHRTIVELESIR
jgi:hypothetical protein